MKLVIIADKKDHKLQGGAYSQSYFDCFKSVIKRFDKDSQVWVIYGSVPAREIDADVLMFYDLHSSHHVSIDGIRRHQSLKIEFMNDPHQQAMKGKYRDGTPVEKLGPADRVARARARGVDYIWCPYREGYRRFLAPHIGDDAEKMLMWYPTGPDKSRFKDRETRLEKRQPEVLANGATWAGDLSCYNFRRWVFGRLSCTFFDHVLRDENTPAGKAYGKFLCGYAGAVAACDWYPVPKYFEMPLAGCVTFVQWLDEMEELGFKDGENCIAVTKENFDEVSEDFLSNVGDYQGMADAGRRLVEQNFTADRFANYVYDFCKAKLNGG
jgi:hypothetical protein